MKTSPINKDVVVDVAKTLVENGGDVNKVYSSLNGIVPKKTILKIRNKRIMSSITDQFFKRGEFDSDRPSTEKVIVGDFDRGIGFSMTTNEETNQTANKKPKRRPPLSEEKVRKICESLIHNNGSTKDVVNEFGGEVTSSQIVNIKSGHTRPDITKEYFTVKPWTPLVRVETPQPTTIIVAEETNALDILMRETPRGIEQIAARKIKTEWSVPRIMNTVKSDDPQMSIETLFVLVDNYVGQLSLENIIKLIQE